ncbi:AraC family transcriptional regulator [Rhodococcus pseudokoreensis]|uniref:AraC family transcriptional regulator n=1 Tax=Rhodococcus pseudokoreensis TaxID=2811421 RepID=A0A974ZX96_9NOCA|nr:AraC family transcriptional regulator [Rhodococcus pseudokoreensis]QSE93745.1 AraC family transcriptional regulator [Rhodococcus pseudokoreensis]
MKPLARYATLIGYLDVCRDVGIEPVPLMKDAGVDVGGLGTQDRWISAAAIARLLEQSAAQSGREDFGLQLAVRRQFANLGPLSVVVRDEPDVRSALRILARYTHVYNEALQPHLHEANGVMTVRIDTNVGEQIEARQFVELGVAAIYRLLRGFIGSRWKPLAVCFPHPAPADVSTHRRIFGGTINFDSDFTGIVIESRDLDSPNRMSDPSLRPYTHHILASFGEPGDVSVALRVRESIEVLLPTGRCSAEQVARSLGIDRRSLHRRLTETGETYSSILNSVRTDLAERMVGSARPDLTEISTLLAFSAPSSFSRWFHGQFGCSPTQWRLQHQSSS